MELTTYDTTRHRVDDVTSHGVSMEMTDDFFFHEWLEDLTLRMNSNPENAELQQAACRFVSFFICYRFIQWVNYFKNPAHLRKNPEKIPNNPKQSQKFPGIPNKNPQPLMTLFTKKYGCGETTLLSR